MMLLTDVLRLDPSDLEVKEPQENRGGQIVEEPRLPGERAVGEGGRGAECGRGERSELDAVVVLVALEALDLLPSADDGGRHVAGQGRHGATVRLGRFLKGTPSCLNCLY